MNAKVTVEYTIKNVCNREDYGRHCLDKTFTSLVKRLIREEGIHGIAEDEYRILSINFTSPAFKK